MSRIKNFISEMKKMRWANKKEVLNGTLGVLAISMFVMAFYLITDMGILAVKNIWSSLF